MSTPLKEAKDCCKERGPAKWTVIYEDERCVVQRSDDGFVLQKPKGVPTLIPIIHRRKPGNERTNR